MSKRRSSRWYVAKADTGRDFVEFMFMSEHNANSEQNYQDAQAEYFSKHRHYLNRIIDTRIAKSANEVIGL